MDDWLRGGLVVLHTASLSEHASRRTVPALVFRVWRRRALPGLSLFWFGVVVQDSNATRLQRSFGSHDSIRTAALQLAIIVVVQCSELIDGGSVKEVGKG